MKKINVCYVTAKFKPVIGGAEISLERLTNNLSGSTVKPVILTSHTNINADLKTENNIRKGNLIKIGFSKELPFSINNSALWYKTVTHGLIGELKHIQKLDLIYFNSTCFFQFPNLLGEIFNFKKPVIIKITALDTFNLIKKTRKKLISRKYKDRLYIHCISNEIRKKALDFGFKKEQLFYCPNPIDLKNFPIKKSSDKSKLKKYPNLSNKLVLNFTGRLALSKNIDKIVEIFKKLEQKRDNIKLLMVGYASHPEIQPLIKNLKKESANILWTGKVANKNISNYLKASDCFIMASKDEGLSNALLEAMATGLCPIVPENISGMKDLIKDGTNGLLYDINDLNPLIKRLEKISQKEIKKMGKKARKKVRDLCDINKIARTHIDFYKYLLNSQGRHD